MFDALAHLADRRAWRICVLAVVFFVAGVALSSSVVSHLDPFGTDDASTESIKARQALQGGGHSLLGVTVVLRNAPIDTRAGRARIKRVSRELRLLPDVDSVKGFLDTRSRVFVSRDGDSTYLSLALTPTDEKARQQAGAAIAEHFADRPGVVVGGGAVAQEQINQQVEKDLRKAELVAFPLLFVLSLLFFRSLVAALLPLMIGALAIVGTLAILRIASEFGSISIFALNLTTALGLGLAIDYSLFVVSRYREEIAKDGPGLPAMRRVMVTAGRTVFFSAATLAAALAALLIFPQRFLYSMGLGGSLVALLAALISVTVLPAVLTILGTRVNALAPDFLKRQAEADARPDEEGFWYRLSRFVMRRRLAVAITTAIVLVAMGIPFLGIKFNTVDPTVLPESASARQAYEAVNTEFPPHRDTPVWLAVRKAQSKAVKRLTWRLRDVRGVREVMPPQRLENGVTAIGAVAPDVYFSDSSQAVVERIRSLSVPDATVLVGGATAEFIDLQDSLVDHTPVAAAIIVAVTLILLFVITGSVVLPVKALIMNALTISAVLGLLVLVFQDGRFEGLLDYASTGALDHTMPILLFAIAFGLSTDYAVFLLSRIKEARDNGASELESVAIGLERTGRIVTAAALLFAIVLGAFATSEIISVKENGVGIALAVLIDASVVRAFLVPSLMAMLGKWNWWAPSPLRRLHESLWNPGRPAPVRDA